MIGHAPQFHHHPHLVLIDRPASPLAERYRRVRLQLERGTTAFPLRPQMTLITSAVPGEGKTTTATNLALAYAENRGHRTLLVDADLRRRSVSRYLAPQPKLGFSDILAGEASLDETLIEMPGSALWVLPAGTQQPTPLDLLQTGNLGVVFAELRRRFDRIVIDSPPTLPFADAAILASQADGVLLLVRAGTTTKPLIRRARESLSGANVLGVVLNDVVFTVVDRYYDRYDDYEPGGRAYARQIEASTIRS